MKGVNAFLALALVLGASVFPICDQAAAQQDEFTVIKAWTTPYLGQPINFLHFRVSLHPSHDVKTEASDFRITIPSAKGKQTVSGRTDPTPTFYQTDTNAHRHVVLGIAPNEDLGALGQIPIHAGTTVVRVVTFVTSADVTAQPAIIKSLEWHPAAASHQSGGHGFVGITFAAGTFGILIQNVAAGSPAQKAGVTAGDELVKINGKSVSDVQVATRIITEASPGDTITIAVYRDGKLFSGSILVAPMTP